MKSSLKIILMVVMAAAIAVIGLSWTSLFSDQRLLREKQAELEKSRKPGKPSPPKRRAFRTS